MASVDRAPSGRTYSSHPPNGAIERNPVCSVRKADISVSGFVPTSLRRKHFMIMRSPKITDELLCSAELRRADMYVPPEVIREGKRLLANPRMLPPFIDSDTLRSSIIRNNAKEALSLS